MKSASYGRARSAPRKAPPLPAACGDTCGAVCEVEVVHAEAVRAARAARPTAAEGERLAALFGALANPTRFGLLTALRAVAGAARPELCVCDLVAVTGASQSMVSHQLGLLREAGLVAPRREGRLVYYRLADDALPRLLDGAVAWVRREAP